MGANKTYQQKGDGEYSLWSWRVDSMLPEFSVGTAARSLQLATFPEAAYRIGLDRRAAPKAATRPWVKHESSFRR
jgi:hypothetical protein